MTETQLALLGLAGNEAIEYNQFVKLFATRERASDVVNPRYQSIGDVMLPRSSVFHYQPKGLKEMGPSNTAPFISNYDRQINMFFNPNYVHDRGAIKMVPLQMSKLEKSYLAGHYNYRRTRQISAVASKPGELLIDNMAPGRLPVVYRRITIQTGFDQAYNELATLMANVGQFSSYNLNQFAEFPLPRAFPSYKLLEFKFEKYMKHFFKRSKDGESLVMEGWDKETLKEFQAESSFWLLDLYGMIMGHGYEQYSLFNRLNEKARSQFNMIFTYNGRCWIVNLQTLINLIGYDDKPSDKKPSAIKIAYFKRFYLSLISLVTPITQETPEVSNDEHVVEEDAESEPASVGDQGKNTNVDNRSGGGSLDDLYKKPVDAKSVGKGQPSDVEPTPVGSQDGGNNKESEGAGSNSDGAGDATDGTEWGTDIPDEVFERATVEQAEVVAADSSYGPTVTADRILQRLARQGQLTTKELKYYTDISRSYKDIEFGGRTLEEIVDIKYSDLELKPEKIGTDSVLVADKSVQQSRTQQFVNGYTKEYLERDIINMILGVQNGGTALVDFDRETTITAESKYDVYKLRLQPVEGGALTTRPFRIPKVDDDGTLFMGGVKIYCQNLRVDIPVRKISPTKVSLSSYYDKKIMIERSPYKVNDFAAWLKAAILNKSRVDKSLVVTLGGQKADQKEVCWYYSVLASRFKEIQFGNYHFKFDTKSLIGDNKAWGKLCNAETWVIGVEGDKPVLIDSSGLISVEGEERGYIEEILGLEIFKAPIPNCTVNINGFMFPIIAVLSYWVGFSEVMKRLKPVYRSIEPGVRPQLSADEYMVQLADERLVFNRRDEFATLIFSGLENMPGTKNFARSQLDDPNVWFSIISNDKVKPSHFSEMGLIYDMFIDPITARELERRKYPLVMDQLLMAAAKLLLSNEASHEVEITEQRFVGTERIPGHVYREFVKSTRQMRNKPGKKKTFDLNPETIMMNILTDSSFQSVEEVNLVHQVKQQEEVTFGGSFGRTDQAMVRRTRGQLDNYAGIISEAGKDSGKVGFISYMTSDAKIVDLAGNIDVDLPGTPAGRGSITANLLYGTTRDDTKRSLFAGVQLSQWMATDSYGPVPLQTSYDTQIAYRTSELYSSVAKDDGEVIEVTKEGMVVKYKNGNTDRFFLGYEIGKGAGENHKHLKITDMKVGDKFTKGKVVAWDSMFLARDIRDPNRVCTKLGTMTRMALGEGQFTFEDSIAISKNYALKSTTPYVKENHFVVNYTDVITMHVKVGDKVEYAQPLADLQDPTSATFNDDSIMNGLDRLGIKQIKAKQAGVITKVEVVYNGDIEDADPSVKKFIQQQDSVRGKMAKYRNNTATDGNVGGNTSVGKSKVYPGTASVSIYIENSLTTTVADKFVAGNQMKGTVGFIYPNPIYTEDGREVDWFFSLKSLLNRMVLSLRDKLVANEVNNVYTIRMIEKYPRYE
ncbi:hypothetical protein D9_0064 [Aeromonas phage D9]|uniref:RNA polymerase beta subunit n=1 Tax=Aeromonas phage D6 TaxID=2593322 RepID=A0A514TWK5_9CAUD|nr:hypothetical protein PQC08_gp040 [Aeromonas phage D6]QDJ97394.1 hypothetical protein D6_0235 [Aeromonas phage D6]QEP52271.1 hypothetical protein D9_0064 [Aeromonas phage D9]